MSSEPQVPQQPAEPFKDLDILAWVEEIRVLVWGKQFMAEIYVAANGYTTSVTGCQGMSIYDCELVPDRPSFHEILCQSTDSLSPLIVSLDSIPCYAYRVFLHVWFGGPQVSALYGSTKALKRYRNGFQSLVHPFVRSITHSSVNIQFFRRSFQLCLLAWQSLQKLLSLPNPFWKIICDSQTFCLYKTQVLLNE